MWVIKGVECGKGFGAGDRSRARVLPSALRPIEGAVCAHDLLQELGLAVHTSCEDLLFGREGSGPSRDGHIGRARQGHRNCVLRTSPPHRHPLGQKDRYCAGRPQRRYRGPCGSCVLGPPVLRCRPTRQDHQARRHRAHPVDGPLWRGPKWLDL